MLKIVLNGLGLWTAKSYFSGFALSGGMEALAVGALVLTFLHATLKPFLKIIATPLIWITLGLFNIVINMLILWSADFLLDSLVISDLATLFWVSFIISIINSFF